MKLNRIFQKLGSYNYSGDLENDAEGILEIFGKEETFYHVKAVTLKALEIAEHYNVDQEKVRIAALLHDFSAIIPPKYRLAVARQLGVEEIKENDIDNPIMLHGKISAQLGKKYFGITDIETLDAMKYHTTLCSDASLAEQIVFIADKIALDPSGKHNAEYMDDVKNTVNDDVTKACWYYLKWMFENLEELDWQRHYNAVAAYEWLNSIYRD